MMKAYKKSLLQRRLSIWLRKFRIKAARGWELFASRWRRPRSILRHAQSRPTPVKVGTGGDDGLKQNDLKAMCDTLASLCIGSRLGTY